MSQDHGMLFFRDFMGRHSLQVWGLVGVCDWDPDSRGCKQLWAALPSGLEGGQALLALLGFNIVVPTEDLREAILERGSSNRKPKNSQITMLNLSLNSWIVTQVKNGYEFVKLSLWFMISETLNTLNSWEICISYWQWRLLPVGQLYQLMIKKRHSANISYSVQKSMEELDNERTHLRYLIYRTHSFKMKGSDLTPKGMDGQVISLSSSYSPSK